MNLAYKYIGFFLLCIFLGTYFFSVREIPLQIVLLVGVALAFFDGLQRKSGGG